MGLAADGATADIRSPGRYLMWLVRCQPRRVMAGAFFGSSWMVSLAVPPYLLSHAIDDGLRPGDSGSLYAWAGAVLGVGLLNAWLAIARHRTMSKLRIESSFRTTRVVVGHVTRLGAELARRVSAGEVVTIGIGDVAAISTALTVTGPGVGAVVSYALVGVLLFTVSTLLALVVLLGVPVLAVLVGPLLGRLLGAQATYRESQSALSARLVDMVEGLRVLNSFGGKDAYAERFRVRSRTLRDQGYDVGAVTSWIAGVAIGLPAVFLGVVTWLAAHLAQQGSITVGQLVAVYGYTAMLVVPVSFFIEGSDMISRALVSARRVIRFLAIEPLPEVASPPPVPVPGPAELVDPESGARIAPGRFTALVSARPSESAAVVERLGRFAESDATWGGARLDAIPAHEFRRHVVVADNDARLFAGPLRDVVDGSGGHDEEAVRRALTTAVADDIVDGLPDGLDAPITSGATNLSGGQRQRLRLARALLADPEVLLAVEPTSALDAHTEALVAERVRAARAGRTTVVTTSSPLVLAHADDVCFLVDGRVAARSPHARLLDTEPRYRAVVSRDSAADGDELGVAVAAPSSPGEAR